MSTIDTDAPSISGQGEREDTCFFPEGSAQERWVALLLFVVSCLYLCLFYHYTALHTDEGILLQGAQRILQGQVLYRDFFSFHTPGSYYWMTLLFKIFGSSILVGRAALVVYGGLFSVLIYLLARRVCTRGASLLAAYLAVVVCLPYSFYVQHNWDSTVLAYLTLYCVVRLLETCSRGAAFAVGSITALTLLFEQSKGAGLLFGLGLGFTFVALCTPKQFRLDRRQLLTLSMGFSWPFVLTFAYFGFRKAVPQMLTAWFWPLHHYSEVNRVRYGYLPLSLSAWEALHSGSWAWRSFAFFAISPSVLLSLLPILGVGILVLQSSRLRRERIREQRLIHYVVVGATLFGVWLSVVAVRSDVAHIVYSVPLFSLAGAWIIDGRDIPSQLLRRAKPILVLYLACSFSAFGFALLLNPLNARYRLDTRRGALKATEPDTVLSYVAAHVPAGERIFVYPYQPLYYYLTATSNPTSYEYLQPGMHTATQSEEVLRQLEDDSTKIAIFTPSFSDLIAISWPSTPLTVIAARDPVADYIVGHYHPCKTLNSGPWIYFYMLRKDLPCPDNPEPTRRQP
jgi:4-amino-4-deoxy-L-arabinose transferase-like glycosyltransferase